MPATYTLVPGISIGPFLLGDSLWHILDLLRTEKRSNPKVELAWDTSKAHESDLVLTLPNLILYFPHPSQRLARLEITNLSTSTLTLSYEDRVLRSVNQSLTRGLVGRTLGPTYGDGGVLSYPGIRLSTSTTEGKGPTRDDKIETITILPKEEDVLPSAISLTKVDVHPNKGVTLHIPNPVELSIGQTTAQDVLLDLGSPLRKYVKEDDRMDKIWGGQNQQASDKDKGTFWNYFQHGLDILISPDNLVSKIVLHSNIPGTPLFQTHARCPWNLSSASGSLDHTSPVSSFRAHFIGEPVPIPTPLAEDLSLRVPTPTPNPAGNSKKKNKKGSSGPSSFNENGGALENRVQPNDSNGNTSQTRKEVDSEGMILDRVVEGGLDGVEGMSPSCLVGFEGLILEEDRGSGGIASVLIFRQE